LRLPYMFAIYSDILIIVWNINSMTPSMHFKTFEKLSLHLGASFCQDAVKLQPFYDIF
jgi:hypothetical protein